MCTFENSTKCNKVSFDWIEVLDSRSAELKGLLRLSEMNSSEFIHITTCFFKNAHSLHICNNIFPKPNFISDELTLLARKNLGPR